MHADGRDQTARLRQNAIRESDAPFLADAMRRLIGSLFAALSVAWVDAAGQSLTLDADSLVLERTLCFGTCPAYRLSLTRDGHIRFQSRNPGDASVAADRAAPGTLRELVRLAQTAGFFALPPRILGDRRLCPDEATDHPTVTIAIHSADTVHRVEDYRGCYQASDHSVGDALRRLRRFEATVDSVLGSERWVRPARRR